MTRHERGAGVVTPECRSARRLLNRGLRPAVEDLLFTCRNHVDPRLGIRIVGIHETIHGSRGLLETSVGQFLLEVSVGC